MVQVRCQGADPKQRVLIQTIWITPRMWDSRKTVYAVMQLAKTDLFVYKLLEVEERWCRHTAYFVEYNAKKTKEKSTTDRGNNEQSTLFFLTKNFKNWICPSFKRCETCLGCKWNQTLPTNCIFHFPNNFPGTQMGLKWIFSKCWI